MASRTKIAILDDYQQVALHMADWSAVKEKADVVVFTDHVSDPVALIGRLHSFQVICVMRERTPLNREILSQLTNLRLIVSTGPINASIDSQATDDLGIKIVNTRYSSIAAAELTWSLLMALARHIPEENATFRVGGWQQTIGTNLSGKTIGIVGLGNIGSVIAGYAQAFNMNILAWSEHLTEEMARQTGAKLASKDTLFKESDFVTIHLVLSHYSKNTVTGRELNLMKRSAYLINTSRGPLVDEAALVNALQKREIAGAAIDVFNEEPLPTDHPLRKLNNALCTSHIGFVTDDMYKVFYEDTVEAILHWLEGTQISNPLN